MATVGMVKVEAMVVKFDEGINGYVSCARKDCGGQWNFAYKWVIKSQQEKAGRSLELDSKLTPRPNCFHCC